ncbi:nucleolar pre-ribosomal-associated protein 1 [Aricia agestis]|uniref:nucleolar pre-ribosomal-associated protein 1 n=1 Tax=Aricia agestis TaxID=91739 RepID=UPI001C207F35|nr:nucleolar pre-ribosomal-associated protein 1 [Aricia agestis]
MGKRKYTEDEQSAKKKSKNDENSQDEDMDDASEEQPENKVPSKPAPVPRQNLIDIKHFRKELTNKQGQTMALTQFLQVCLNPDANIDYMLEYLKSGGNSHEILRQISQDNKKNLTLATPTFHLFHLIILKVQSSLPHMITITEEACRYFLNTFVPTVEIMISENSGPRHRKIVLNLLTSIVTLNSDLGIEVLNQIPLTPKNLQYIIEKPNYKEKDNVRTAFVHFITSFLVDGHLPLIKALLEKPGLLPLVIPGLIQDEPNSVLMFLNILKKNVIDNLLISKTLKLKTFSHQVLNNLFRVFLWKGPPDMSSELKSESHNEIMLLVSEIILTLFTSHKYGLYFVDDSLGTSDANKNQNLYKCLLSLKRPWDNPHQCEAVLNIIYKCPDLHRAIINLIEQSFEPQNSPTWKSVTQFTIQLLDKMKPEDLFLRFKKLSPTQTVNFIRFVTLPVPLLKIIHLNIGKDLNISLYCVKVLVKMLQTVKRYIQILEAEDTDVNVAELKQKLENFLPKHVPPPTSVIALINNVINRSNSQTTQDNNLPKIEDAEAMLLLVDLLLLYNNTHPAFFESLETSIDMKKILEFSSTLSSGPISLLKFKIISLWLMLDSTVLTLQNPMFKDLFLIMLEVYTNDDDDTWIEAKDTLQIFLRNTGIFESDEDEIHLMMYTLRHSKVNQISLVADIVEHVLKNGKELSQHVREQVVNLEISNEENQADLDKLLNDLMNSKNTDDSAFLENKIPSSFIVGCMQFIQNNRDAKKHLKQFLCLYVTNLLHCNYSPELTEVLIGDSKLDVRSYVANWLVEPIPLSESTCNDATLINLSNSIIRNEVVNLNDIFNFIELSEDGNLVVEEMTYKINATETIDSSKLFMWAKYLMFCIVRLTTMEKIDEEHLLKIEKYFDVLIALGKKHHMISDCRNIILNMLKNPHFLKMYQPVDLNKKDNNIVATKLMTKIIKKYQDIVTYLNKKYYVLKPYQQKNYNEVLKMFIKIKKKKNINSEYTISVIETIGLSKESDYQILEQIFTCDIESYVKEDKEQSLALDLLCTLLDKYSRVSTDFTQEIKKIIPLYTKLLTNKEVTPNLTKLEASMINFFENKPNLVVNVKEDDFRQFFQANTVRKTTSQLASILMKLNKRYINVFVEQIKRPEILSQRELTLPIGNAAISHSEFLAEHKNVLSEIYREYKSNIVKFLERPHKAGQVYLNSWQLIRKVVIECMEETECCKIFNKTHKFEALDASHLQVLHVAFVKLCLSNTLKNDQVINYITTMLQVCSNALKENKEDDLIFIITSNIENILKVAKNVIGNFKTDEKDDCKKITDSAVWHGFCKSVLKDSLRVKTVDRANVTGPKTLSLLSNLIRVFYSTDAEDIVTLFDMVTSHSEFLNVMLSYHSPDIKYRLLELLYVLMSINKSVLKSQQIPVYLSAYRATRSPSDRLILTILWFYEHSMLPVNEYKPYLFGDSAANFYAVRKSKISTLWGHPSPNQVINLYDKETIARTIKHFPVNQKLNYNHQSKSESITNFLNRLRHEKPKVKDVELNVDNLIHKEHHLQILHAIQSPDVLFASHSEEDESIYDPAFVYPHLSQLMAPGSVASCFKLLRSGLLSLVVAGLGSRCPRMRAAAYHVLHRFWQLLETERHKNDKLLLTDFITTLRASLSTAIDESLWNMRNPQLPAIGALYLARALMVSTSPSEPLYRPVNNFLIAKQTVDLTVVPDFLSLFHDSEVETVDRRNWTLEIIRDGTKTMSDVTVIFKTMCLKMIMGFYSSSLCDRRTKIQILRTLNSIITIPRAFEILVEGYSLLSWLHCVARELTKEDRSVVKEVLVLLKNMIDSVNIIGFVKHCSKVEEAKVDSLAQFKVKSDVEYEILTIICNMLPSVGSEEEELVIYLKLLNLVTKRSIKFLNKNQMINIIAKCVKDNDCMKMFKQSVVSKNHLMLSSKLLDSPALDKYLMDELKTLLHTFID